MKKKDSQFLPIAEQYLKYKNKRDFYNMHRLQYNYNISFKSIFDCAYMQIGDEQFLYDYNYKTNKYCIEEIRKIEGVRALFVKQIKDRMEKCFEKENYEM